MPRRKTIDDKHPPAPEGDEEMSKDLTQYVNTEKAGELLGLLPTSVNHLIYGNRLKAIKPGRDWLVYLPSIEEYQKTKSAKGRRSSRTPSLR